jgi:hypothetical protein
MKDLVHCIVYEAKDGLYPKVYRYVTMREAKNLFEHHQLFFTNTSCWCANATNESGDSSETLFENWWMNCENLKIYIKTLNENYCKKLEAFNLPYSIDLFKSEWSSHLNKIMSIQNDTYSYCTAGEWNEPAMIREYHDKWKRNIIFEFKKNFYYDIAICHEKIPLKGDVLCADVFKMTYVSSITEYIKKLSENPVNSNLGHMVYDVGTFIKDNKFQYEKEQRIKVQLLSSEILSGTCNLGDVYTELYGLSSLEEIYEKSADMLQYIRQKYVLKGRMINDLKYFDTSSNTEYLVIDDIRPQIVENIYLFKGISDEDRRKIYQWSIKYGIGVKELNI